mgnify:CR=1 FL=1
MDNKATSYAEKYGILDYKVIGKTMVYYSNYLNERITYKVTVNLVTMAEKSRKKMSRYYQKGNVNMYL